MEIYHQCLQNTTSNLSDFIEYSFLLQSALYLSFLGFDETPPQCYILHSILRKKLFWLSKDYEYIFKTQTVCRDILQDGNLLEYVSYLKAYRVFKKLWTKKPRVHNTKTTDVCVYIVDLVGKAVYQLIKF